jgi:hypothetical protein
VRTCFIRSVVCCENVVIKLVMSSRGTSVNSNTSKLTKMSVFLSVLIVVSEQMLLSSLCGICIARLIS